jgi:hypothetical protein
MAHILAARVGAMSTTTGTGNIAFSAALTAHRAFEDVLPNGSTTEYLIYAINTAGAASGQWEVGVGTYYNAGDAGGERLVRTTVHETSSNDASAINFGAGDKVVVISPLASRLMAIPVADSTSDKRAMHFDASSNQMYWSGVPYARLLPNPNPGNLLNVYVNASTGDDTNTGLTNIAPLQSLDAAVALVFRYRALSGAYIRLAAGAYDSANMPATPLDYPLTLTIVGAGASSTSIYSLVCGHGRVGLELSDLRVRDSVTVANLSAQSCTFDQSGEYGTNADQITVMQPRDELNQPFGRGRANLNQCTFAGNSGCRISLQKFCDGTLANSTWGSGSNSYEAVMKMADHCVMTVDGGSGTTTGKRADVGHFSLIKTYGPGSGVETFLRGDSAATFGHASAVV